MDGSAVSQQIGSATPREVTRWQCRACKSLVGITADAAELYEKFCNELVRRGEPHLDNRQIVFCSSCRVHYRQKLGEHNAKRMGEMRDVIRRLKGSRNPEAERAAIKQLEAWGHPDVPGLVQSIRNRLDGIAPDGQRKRRAGDA